MSGIYIHIPFCSQKCNYCDFYSSYSMRHRHHFAAVLQNEIALRKDYLADKNIQTIYIGGGTPSLLSTNEINALFDTINKYYHMSSDAEITLEANPDDLSVKYLKELSNTAVNRLSIGIQSFDNNVLRSLNRRHSAEQAIEVVSNAKNMGTFSLTLDLIYGIPNQNTDVFERNIQQTLLFEPQHISAYHLTIEPKTVFDFMIRKGTIVEMNEDESLQQFNTLINHLQNKGYEHYEISNFALPGHYSKHNTSYWKQIPYIGLGPSAHSYNGISRQWNCADLTKYINNISQNKDSHDIEYLSTTDKYNEYIMTSLRTMWGVSSNYIRQTYGEQYYRYFTANISSFVSAKQIQVAADVFSLTHEGKFISDAIIEKLFFV